MNPDDLYSSGILGSYLLAYHTFKTDAEFNIHYTIWQTVNNVCFVLFLKTFWGRRKICVPFISNLIKIINKSSFKKSQSKPLSIFNLCIFWQARMHDKRTSHIFFWGKLQNKNCNFFFPLSRKRSTRKLVLIQFEVLKNWGEEMNKNKPVICTFTQIL